MCDGMTYEEIFERMPEEYARRKKDKLLYRSAPGWAVGPGPLGLGMLGVGLWGVMMLQRRKWRRRKEQAAMCRVWPAGGVQPGLQDHCTCWSSARPGAAWGQCAATGWAGCASPLRAVAAPCK
jgi:hypothetical protein